MRIPHVLPYQGSKRKLANDILKYINFDVKGSFYEPFAGSAALTLAAAVQNIGNSYVVGDKYEPLIKLWELIVNNPLYVTESYSNVWNSQLDDPKVHFNKIRGEYNQKNDPVYFLYLVARCVKNSIRFNRLGEFNQSADNRRLGMKPSKVATEVNCASSLLKGKVSFIAGDFMSILDKAGPDDLIYMDPPWQGTSLNKDPRYAYLLEIDSLVEGLVDLNERNIPYLLSFDGTCGKKQYSKKLPKSLNLERVGLNAGRSSQATLLGRIDHTVESLYRSPALVEKNKSGTKVTEKMSMFG